MELRFGSLLELRQTAVLYELPLEGEREVLAARLFRAGVKKLAPLTSRSSDLYLAVPIHVRCDNCYDRIEVVTPIKPRVLLASDVRNIFTELDVPGRTLADLNRLLPVGTVIHLIPSLPYTFPYEPPEDDPREGCFNADVQSVALRYESTGRTYCFDATTIPTLRQTGLNPYTGRPLDSNFREKLHSEPEDITTNCSKEKSEDIEFSADALRWLSSWMVVGVFGWTDHYYQIPVALSKEFSRLRLCEPVLVYRGLTSQSPLMLDLNYTSNVLTSWTYDYERAEHYAREQVYGVIISAWVEPHDMLLDATFLPEWFYAYTGAPDQQEVIVLPGTLTLEKVEVLTRDT